MLFESSVKRVNHICYALRLLCGLLCNQYWRPAPAFIISPFCWVKNTCIAMVSFSLKSFMKMSFCVCQLFDLLSRLQNESSRQVYKQTSRQVGTALSALLTFSTPSERSLASPVITIADFWSMCLFTSGLSLRAGLWDISAYKFCDAKILQKAWHSSPPLSCEDSPCRCAHDVPSLA